MLQVSLTCYAVVLLHIGFLNYWKLINLHVIILVIKPVAVNVFFRLFVFKCCWDFRPLCLITRLRSANSCDSSVDSKNITFFNFQVKNAFLLSLSVVSDTCVRG